MKQINEVLNKRSYYRTLESSYICDAAKTIINNLFPDKKISVVSFKNGNLKIKTENNYLLTEIKIRQKEIIKKINEKIKKEKIKKISFFY